MILFTEDLQHPVYEFPLHKKSSITLSMDIRYLNIYKQYSPWDKFLLIWYIYTSCKIDHRPYVWHLIYNMPVTIINKLIKKDKQQVRHVLSSSFVHYSIEILSKNMIILCLL
jgi:hypothetical protein